MKTIDRLAILTMTTAGLLTACAGDDPSPGSETVLDDGTRIVAAGRGETLSETSHASATEAVKAFLRDRGRMADQLRFEGEARTGDRTHVRFMQIVDGLRVHGAYAKATVNGDGKLVHVIEKLAHTTMTPTPATITASDALYRVLIELGYDPSTAGASTLTSGNLARFAKTAELYREPSVERVAYIDGKQLRVGFLVETWSRIGNQLDHTLVGGDGTIISTEKRTSNDSYNVFLEDPGKNNGEQTVVTRDGSWLAGAQTTHSIRGPNAHAYLDTDANNTPDSGGTAVTDGNFLATANLAESPSTTKNKAVAVQNLFYLNNHTHDLLASHGFTVAAGNFEGNDYVKAEAQDGSGTDNANFATPADGTSPRMQMYLWSGSATNVEVLVSSLTIGGYQSSFGPAFTTTGVSAALGVASPADGCSAISGVSGKIAIVNRGTCDFTVKVQNAQNAGAVAVLIVNNTDRASFAPGGTSRKVRIPSAMVSLADGDVLKENANVTSTARKDSVVPPMLDGDVDSDIVYHEYGHGLTWRMVGNMSGPISGAIGEGASDTLAFLINGDDRIGEYSAADPYGIRRDPYGAYTRNYTAVTGAEVHDDGEIFAAAMWQVLLEYTSPPVALSANDLLDDFVKGLDYAPAGPSFEAMRDALATQARTHADDDLRYCAVHRGFARLGIGVGSKAVVKGRGVQITPSSAVPAGCPAL